MSDPAPIPPRHRPDLILDGVMPREFLAHSLKVIRAGHPASYGETYERFPKEEAHDLLGHVRRAAIEAAWRRMAKRHSASGVTAEVLRNRQLTSYYTVVRCGMVVMTISAVPDPSTIVRDAAFRTTFAEDNQLPLYETTTRRPCPASPLYAILLHGANPKNNAELGFAEIKFPMLGETGKIERYHPWSIDLIRSYSAIIDKTNGVPEEKIVDTLRIEIRRARGEA